MPTPRSSDRPRRLAIPMILRTGAVALVDDDPSLLRAMERALVAYGYRVKTFSSAEQYLEEANPAEILCAVVDIHLHGAPVGLDLGHEISVSEDAPPVVFMTASDDPALRERALDIGCAEFLEKPFLISRLVGVIMRLEGRDPATIR